VDEPFLFETLRIRRDMAIDTLPRYPSHWCSLAEIDGLARSYCNICSKFTLGADEEWVTAKPQSKYTNDGHASKVLWHNALTIPPSTTKSVRLFRYGKDHLVADPMSRTSEPCFSEILRSTYKLGSDSASSATRRFFIPSESDRPCTLKDWPGIP